MATFRKWKNCRWRLRDRKLGGVYEQMISRCHDSNHKYFYCYGERGITVCDEWRQSRDAFMEWAFANGYKRGLTLERKKNNLGYSPGNCDWVTRKQQAANRRTNLHVTAFGETHIIVDWSRDKRCAVSEPSLRRRLREGWKPELAIATPPIPRKLAPKVKVLIGRS